MVKNYSSMGVKEVLSFFGVDATRGLDEKRAKQILTEEGPNEIPRIKKSLWRVYLAPLFNIFIVMVFISGTLMTILGNYGSATISFAVVGVNSLTAIVQQYRAQRTIESLKKMTAPEANVLREGVVKRIPASLVVPGDILIVNAGDRIPADARIIECTNMTVNEAPLTGESEAVEKFPEPIHEEVHFAPNMLYMGTFVLTGNGKAVVVATGGDTELGKISKTAAETSTSEILLVKKLNNIAKIIASLVVVVFIIEASYQLWLYNTGRVPFTLNQTLIYSITIAMNSVPTNLPLLTTLILLTGVLEMAQKGVIIKNLSAIETLGRISVLCTDKTGTLTKGEMMVQRIWCDNKEYIVTGSGYDPRGKILLEKKAVKPHGKDPLNMLIIAGVINNNTSITRKVQKVFGKEDKKVTWKISGSPTEAALIVLARKVGYNVEKLRKEYPRLREFPFDSKVKRMTSVVKHDKRLIAFIKGAPEILLHNSTYYLTKNGKRPFSTVEKKKIEEILAKFAEAGYRTLAIAMRMLDRDIEKRDEVERDLTFIGLVAILDPPREGVRDAVKKCESAGIIPVMITGDHPKTAKAIAAQIGIYNPGEEVVEGKNIDKIRPEDVEKIAVFARVSPEDKKKIVDVYKANNKVVAMTGDGVNDAPALQRADVGVAMGITGTDVAKEAADMIISDDNFVSIVRGIETGRGILSKIRALLYFYVCMDFMESMLFFSMSFIPGFQMFSAPWQYLFIYATVHSLPGFGLVFDRLPKGVMNRPPMDTEELIPVKLAKLLVLQAFTMLVSIAGIYWLTMYGIIPVFPENLTGIIDPRISLAQQKARTLTVGTLFLNEMMMAWIIRRPNKPLWKSVKEEFNPVLFVMCVLVMFAFVGLIYVPEAQKWLLQTVGMDFYWMHLSIVDWLIILIFVATPVAVVELYKKQSRRKGIFY